MADVGLVSVSVYADPSDILEGVSGAALAVGEVVYLSASDTWSKCDANAGSGISPSGRSVCGVVHHGGAATGSRVWVALKGRVSGLSGLTAGNSVWLSETAGAMATSAPSTAWSTSIKLGVANTTTSVVFDPSAAVNAMRVSAEIVAAVPTTAGVGGNLTITPIVGALTTATIIVTPGNLATAAVGPWFPVVGGTGNKDIALTATGELVAETTYTLHVLIAVKN